MTAEYRGNPSSARGRRIWLGYWVALFLLTHVPLPAGPGALPSGTDKFLHFGAYCLLTLLGGRLLDVVHRRAPISLLLVWAVIYALFAAADEWLQQFVGRTASLSDWIADVVGIAAGTLVLVLHRRRMAVR